MISITEHNGRYYVSFKGQKHQFTEYINKLMSVEEKDYDLDRKSWVFDEQGIAKIKQLFEKPTPKKKSAPPVRKVAPIEVIREIPADHDIGSTMKLPPYDYQKETIENILQTKETLIVLPCGAGKTAIGIGAYLELKRHGDVKTPGLIVVKASLKYQWHKEVAKFSNLTSRVILSPKEVSASTNAMIKRRESAIKREEKKQNTSKVRELKKEVLALRKQAIREFEDQFVGVDLFILNYETLREQDVRKALREAQVKYIFADEVHMIKSRESKRSKALSEFADVPYKIGATATPVGKNPEDLFSIYRFVAPKLFPTWNSFSALYIKWASFGKIAGFKNLDNLREKIAPKLFVKSKEEVSDQLPGLVVMQRYAELTSQQAAMHSSIMEKLDELKNEERAIRARFTSERDAINNPDLMRVEGLILMHQTFAQQLANDERLFAMSDSESAKDFITGSKSNKMDLLIELVDEILSSGEKVAVYSRFKRMQDIITKEFNNHFPQAKIAYINGSVSAEERYEEAYTKFRDNDDYKVLLSTYSGAEGLNLSQCKYLILFEPAESYQIQTQIFGRLERADSIHDTVFVYELICNDSWDEVQKKIVNKKEGYDIELIRKE